MSMLKALPKSVVFYSLLITLICGGAWGVLLILGKPADHSSNQTLSNNTSSDTDATHTENKEINNGNFDTPAAEPTFNELISKLSNEHSGASEASQPNQQVKLIDILLSESRYARVTAYVNENYSSFSSQDLIQIRRLYADHAHDLTRRGADGDLIELYRSESTVFNDLQAWTKLSGIAIKTQKWQIAYDATLQASLQESDGFELQKWFKRLFRVTGNLRSSLEKQGDKLGVHELYKTLYKTHPGHPRFQLELAYSYLRLNRPGDARPLLEQLQFDLELGEVSRDVLARINQTKSDNVTNVSPEPPSPDIAIPLQRQGTNLIANVGIGSRSVALLLDTGASITALDNRLIEKLGLAPTGQVIRLSTANGVRTARLYNVRQMQLGRFRLRNHTVAGIDLGRTGAFSGLLGTDLLNNLSQDYSFLIDNEKSALIFRHKR